MKPVAKSSSDSESPQPKAKSSKTKKPAVSSDEAPVTSKILQLKSRKAIAANRRGARKKMSRATTVRLQLKPKHLPRRSKKHLPGSRPRPATRILKSHRPKNPLV
ncbi:hypothetical protein SPRG_21327 [Saprolegnia parasitica CBS 223.65]|uniref:Uncharacterized protein n=1 Tax=Saprolegnia parasitica (strain CBS 223.65) TaxID=695850 RepID=A0A067C3H5_SAPPC|nr:hypothetical protein SPRG_21327 [Saprolegnia parasitica CBS 223.65]KDO21357.1 hypothetical protein SPRG_21327 [Saprolegnia parasitica CBS 223.65]|eukprot:XP_012207954.1 hypothetical protein SPRG_21327 [Saprolegnia parasitica CBS 223.65]